jgi:amino acid adenylation domain-containing protein
VLGRWCEQDDVVVGAPVAGRDRAALEPLIGFFVNTLVLRVDIAGDPSFDALVQRVRDVALDAFTHAEMPFEALVEDLAPERDLSRNPLFQVTFQLFESPTAPDAVAAHQQLDAPVTSSLFDLRVDLARGTSGLAGRIEYDTELFDEDSIRWLIERFAFVCEQWAADAGLRLSTLDWVPPAQRRLLADFNATEAPVPGLSVPERLERLAAETPGAPAVADPLGVWTFGELHERAGTLAGALASAGVEAGDVVAVCLPRGRAMIAGALAAMRLGAAYLPLDVAYPASRLAHVLADARPAAVVTTAEHAPRPEPDAIVVTVDAWPVADAPELAGVGAEDAAYVIYTSGSTGAPKGVVLTHGGLLNLVEWHRRAYAVTAEDRGGQVSSAGFDAAVWEIWPQLCAGGCVSVCDDETRGDIDALIGWLREQQITICFIPTPLAELVLDRPWPQDAPLRFLLTGGDTLRRPANPQHPYTLVNHYGPTETTVVATAGAVGDHDDRPSIGAPIANTTAYVVDRHGCLAGPGQPGELWLGGRSLARGYHHDPALTDERFVPNPFAAEPARLYRTGDRVHWRADGTLAFLGRTDRQIKIRGHRIEPREIETMLATHPQIAHAVVSADPELSAHIVARGTPPSAAGLRRWLRDRLPGPMVPVAYAFLDEWPLTPNGKLDLQRLPPAVRVDADGGLRAAPADQLEEALCRLFEQTLRVEEVGVEDDFFDRGGHSLLATQLLTRIRDAFDVELPLRTLFERRTVAGIAGELRGQARSPEALVEAAGMLLHVLSLSDEDVEALLGAGDPGSRA